MSTNEIAYNVSTYLAGQADEARPAVRFAVLVTLLEQMVVGRDIETDAAIDFGQLAADNLQDDPYIALHENSENIGSAAQAAVQALRLAAAASGGAPVHITGVQGVYLHFGENSDEASE